jgi:hypothetical protein
MKSEMTRGGLLFIDSKISTTVLVTAADSFRIRTEAVLFSNRC